MAQERNLSSQIRFLVIKALQMEDRKKGQEEDL